MIPVAQKPGASLGVSALLRDGSSISIIQYLGRCQVSSHDDASQVTSSLLDNALGTRVGVWYTFIPAQLWGESNPKMIDTKSPVWLMPVCHYHDMFFLTLAMIPSSHPASLLLCLCNGRNCFAVSLSPPLLKHDDWEKILWHLLASLW